MWNLRSSKNHQEAFFQAGRNAQILELVYSNIYELNEILTRDGKWYFIAFLDDCSRYIYMYLIRSKDEAIKFFFYLIK